MDGIQCHLGQSIETDFFDFYEIWRKSVYFHQNIEAHMPFRPSAKQVLMDYMTGECLLWIIYAIGDAYYAYFDIKFMA